MSIMEDIFFKDLDVCGVYSENIAKNLHIQTVLVPKLLMNWLLKRQSLIYSCISISITYLAIVQDLLYYTYKI